MGFINFCRNQDQLGSGVSLNYKGKGQYGTILGGCLSFCTTIFFTANPLILNSIAVIANVWFADDERAQAMAIASLMAPLGSLLGLTISGVIAAGVDETDPVDCYNRFTSMVYIQNGIFTGLLLAVFLFVREKPKTPPSRTAMTFKQFSGDGVL